MNWLFKTVNNFFNATFKEIISLLIGLTFCFVGLRYKLPNWSNVYIFAVLILLSSLLRYNFVGDSVQKNDFEDLSKNRNILSYILGKCFFSYALTILIIFVHSLILFFLNSSLINIDLFKTLLILGLLVVAYENIIFIFHNKGVKLRSNDFSTAENIDLGFKDLIDSIPSIVSTILLVLFYVYVGLPSWYSAIILFLASVIFLHTKIKRLIEL